MSRHGSSHTSDRTTYHAQLILAEEGPKVTRMVPRALFVAENPCLERIFEIKLSKMGMTVLVLDRRLMTNPTDVVNPIEDGLCRC